MERKRTLILFKCLKRQTAEQCALLGGLAGWSGAHPPTLPRRNRSTLGVWRLHGLVRDGAAWVTPTSTRAKILPPSSPSLNPIRIITPTPPWFRPGLPHRRPHSGRLPTRGIRRALGCAPWWALPVAGPPPPVACLVIFQAPLTLACLEDLSCGRFPT